MEKFLLNITKKVRAVLVSNLVFYLNADERQCKTYPFHSQCKVQQDNYLFEHARDGDNTLSWANKYGVVNFLRVQNKI